MHKWAGTGDRIVATFICSACLQEVGFTLDQLNNMIESNNFTFWCPSKSAFAKLYPPQVHQAYENLLYSGRK